MEKKKKLLITNQIPKEGIAELDKYFDVTYPDKLQMNTADVLAVIKDYEVIIACSVRADKNFFDKAEKLEFISNFGVGYDNVDLDCAASRKIVVTNTPYTVTEGTAELAFGLMISVMRRITECDRKLRTVPDLRWGLMYNLGQTLYDRSLGIIGMGRIGQSLARRAIASGMKIFYHNRHRLDKTLEQKHSAVYLTMEELLKTCDVVSVNVPLNNETRHLIGEKEFAMMKKDTYIINTARGPVIDEMAMIRYLKEGRIAGAGLDVFENEPKINKEFFTLDNAVITPHIGTASIYARTLMGREASQNIINYYLNKKPVNVVNPEVLKK